MDNRFIYGHESTHAVKALSLETPFMEMLNSLGFKLNPFEKYNDEEEICHIGGLVGLYKLNLHDIFVSTHSNFSYLLEDLLKSKK